MSAAAIIEQARTLGVSLRIAHDKIKVKGPSPAVEQLLPVIREHKPELLAALADKPAGRITHLARTCADCINITRFGNCVQPVAAGLAPYFQLMAAPDGYAATCAAFEPISAPATVEPASETRTGRPE
jgi:hypothetical protein